MPMYESQKKYFKTAKGKAKLREINHKYHELTKAMFVELLGNKCSKCGIIATNENLVIFDFHHINPDEKDFDISSRQRKFIKEIRSGKIQLLCANCHRLEHKNLDGFRE